MSAVDPYLTALAESDASAVHLRAGDVPAWRVDGNVVPNGDPMPTGEEFEEMILDLAAGAGLVEELRNQAELEFTHETANNRFRIQIYRADGGRHVVVTRSAAGARRPAALGIPDALRDEMTRGQGVILLAGARASGRTTTVASLLDCVNRETSRYIVSIERPILIDIAPQLSVVHQIEVGSDARGFPGAIKTAVAAGANLIAVGAVEDEATACEVLRAAENGALVLAVLTAHGVTDACGRFLDLLPERFHGFFRSQLAHTLRLAAYQQLLPRRDGHREALFEYARGTEEVRDLIRGNRVSDLPAILDDPRCPDHFGLDCALEKLLRRRKIDADLAFRLCRNRKTIERAVATT